VLHCGALVSDWATTHEITRTNVTGTRNLLDACADNAVARFVHLSTTDIYGHPGGPAVSEDCAPVGFANWYAQTKLNAEREVRRAEAQSGLDAVILRPATVYGPGSRDVVGGIARAMRSRNMLLIDGGRYVAGLCFVENLVDAAVLALGHEAVRGHALNVSDGLRVTWREFTDGLAEGLGFSRVRWSVPYWVANGVGTALEHGYRFARGATGVTRRPLLARQAVQVLGRDQNFSNRRARALLGWEPRVEYAIGLEATLAWLREEYLV
jgi:nucleoside-diphosphate-sugar epimerase